MNVIFEYFDKVLPMTEKEIEEVRPYLKTKTVLKNDFLLSEDQTCRFMAFIKRGSFRHFHINPNGSLTNIWFSSTNELLSNYHSFRSGIPSNISIQAIEESEIIIIHKDDFDNLLENSFYWNKLGRLMVENIFFLSVNRLESMIYKTNEERYLDLVANSPEFLQKYSLTDIASFLGITIQSLSRIRARQCNLP